MKQPKSIKYMKQIIGILLTFLFLPLAIFPFGRKLLDNIYDNFIYY